MDCRANRRASRFIRPDRHNIPLRDQIEKLIENRVFLRSSIVLVSDILTQCL
jgi:hypothetical protein